MSSYQEEESYLIIPFLRASIILAPNFLLTPMTSIAVANDFRAPWTTVFSVFPIPDVGSSVLRPVSHCRRESR